jgi:hypothetical protein
MSQPFDFKVPITSLSWSYESPDVGDPTCLCSWCGLVIERGVPIRLYRTISDDEVLEARLHDACCEPVLGMKVQSFDDDDIPWPDDDEIWAADGSGLCYCHGDEYGHDPDPLGVFHVGEQVLERARKERGDG